jgi:hypothetical protein
MTAHAIAPHTRIDNAIIDKVADTIGIYGLGIYLAIKRHLNQKTGDCFPSYKTIARKLGIDRGTVIRYVKKLKAVGLVDPEWRFKEDGSHASNQYNFQGADSSVPSNKSGEVVKTGQAGRPEQPPPVVLDDHPGRPERPEQSESNKKNRTITDVDFFAEKNQQSTIPTEKQKTCRHPLSEVVILAEATICHHCWGLLDDNLQLIEEGKTPQAVAA